MCTCTPRPSPLRDLPFSRQRVPLHPSRSLNLASRAAPVWTRHRPFWKVQCVPPDADEGQSVLNDALPQDSLPATPSTAVSLREELQALAKLSSPAFCQAILGFSLTSIVFLFIGRLGSDCLSVASLACSFFYLTGASIVAGLSMGIETIGGQAHGAGNSHLVALAFFQGISLSLVASVVISLMYCRAESIFIGMGQNAALSKKAALYLQLLIPYLFLDALFTCQSKSLASRGIVRPTTIACGCAILLAPVLSWTLIFKTKLAMYGAPVTLIIAGAFTLSILTLLTRSEPPLVRQSFQEWCQQGWKSMRAYLAVTLPGLATVCSEWWTYEVFTILAGLLPAPVLSLSVMGAADSLINILFSIALALAAGVIVRVSNFLGAGDKRSAVNAARTAVTLCFAMESISLLAICMCARPISAIWFTETAAADAFVSVLPLVSLTEWGSGMGFVLGAVLRACNRSKYEFLVNFSCYCFVGIPLGVLLGFFCKMGVRGFWIALAMAAQIQFLVLATVVSRLDFDLEVKRAQKLTGRSVK